MKACCSSAGSMPCERVGERHELVALREARLHLRHRRLAVRGVEEAAVDLVVLEVGLEVLGLLRPADAAPPDLGDVRREGVGQLVEVAVDVGAGEVEVAREDQRRDLEALLLALLPSLVVVEVRDDDEARHVRPRGRFERPLATLAKALEVRAQGLDLALLDRHHREEAVCLPGDVRIAHSERCASVSILRYAAANASGSIFAALRLSGASLSSSSSDGLDHRDRRLRIGRVVVARLGLVDLDVLLERADRQRLREAVGAAPERRHPAREDVGEGVDVLLPATVEVALEVHVRVAELLLGLLRPVVRDLRDERPAREVDERQVHERLRQLRLALGDGEEDRQERPSPSSLTVLNTVIAIATPSRLREEVPVAVALAAVVVVLTASQTMPRSGRSQVLASAHSTDVQ